MKTTTGHNGVVLETLRKRERQDVPARNTTPQFLRRDFFFGSVAGGVVAGSVALLNAEWSRYPESMTPSYAQSGEDVIVAGIFNYLRIAKPTYLDVGAFLPIYSSNTYLLYRQGSRGVLV